MVLMAKLLPAELCTDQTLGKVSLCMFQGLFPCMLYWDIYIFLACSFVKEVFVAKCQSLKEKLVAIYQNDLSNLT